MTPAEQKATFSKYGRDFQEKFCHLLLKDRSFCDQILEVFDVDFLELKFLKIFVNKVIDYKLEFNTHPSYDTMKAVIISGLEDSNEAVKKQVRDFFARIYKADMGVSVTGIDGEEYIKKESLDFCKKQKLKEAMIKSVKLLKSSSFDEIAKEMNEALKLGSDSNFGYDYIKDFEERFLLKSRNPISTGWQNLDEICRDGLGTGELGVVVAPTGAGKSMVLVHLGSQAIKAGKNVVHYTLELGSTTIASRYDSCITGVSLYDLHSFKDFIYDRIKDMEGNLIIKEYPTKSANPMAIKNHLERLKQRGIKVDLVIVDYADLLRPNIMSKEKRHDLETIYEDLRALAQENECPVWTASQTNRSGLNAEVITMESISEAFNKCFVADFIFSVSRRKEDKEANSGKIFVAKNRNGPDGLTFPITMDPSRVFIEVHRKEEGESSQNKALTAREQRDILKEKYSSFRKTDRG